MDAIEVGCGQAVLIASEGLRPSRLPHNLAHISITRHEIGTRDDSKSGPVDCRGFNLHLLPEPRTSWSPADCGRTHLCATRLMSLMLPGEGSITYPLSSQWWSDDGTLIVRNPRGQTLLELPLQFIRLGRVPSFDFVKEQCRNAFEGEGNLVRMDGSHIDDSELVSAGEVVLAGEGECHWHRRDTDVSD